MAGIEPRHIGGRRALSPLRQFCSLFRSTKTFQLGKMLMQHVPASFPWCLPILKDKSITFPRVFCQHLIIKEIMMTIKIKKYKVSQVKVKNFLLLLILCIKSCK